MPKATAAKIKAKPSAGVNPAWFTTPQNKNIIVIKAPAIAIELKSFKLNWQGRCFYHKIKIRAKWLTGCILGGVNVPHFCYERPQKLPPKNCSPLIIKIVSMIYRVLYLLFYSGPIWKTVVRAIRVWISARDGGQYMAAQVKVVHRGSPQQKSNSHI